MKNYLLHLFPGWLHEFWPRQWAGSSPAGPADSARCSPRGSWSAVGSRCCRRRRSTRTGSSGRTYRPLRTPCRPRGMSGPALLRIRFSRDQKLQRLVVTREPCHNCVFKIYYAKRRLLTACVSICVLWAHRIRLIISTWFSSVGQMGLFQIYTSIFD